MSSPAKRTVRLAVLGLVLTAITACSAADEPEVTVGPQEPATVAELDAGVAPAARALLDAAAVRITAVYFSFANPEQAARFDWLEYRAKGDFFVVYNQLDPRQIEAFTRVGEELYTATITVEGDAPWSALGPQAEPPTELLDLLALLADIAEQPSALAGADVAQAAVTRQEDSTGSVLWTFREIGANPEIIDFGAQWLINSDGVLQFYRVGSDVEPILGFSGIVYEFGIADELEPLQPPAVGAPLDLEEQGVPSELIDVGE